MKKKTGRKFLLGVMVLLVSIVLSACGDDKKTESSESNTSSEQTTGTAAAASGSDANIVIGMAQEVGSLDPHMDTDAGTRSVLFNVFEGLVKPTSDGELIPAVASDYTISDDATVYTFTLRDGITFQDGSEVTVNDIIYSLNRCAEVQGESSALSVIKDISAPDDKTVQITLNEGNSEFLPQLTVAVMPEANDANVTTAPIGTGPFKILSYNPGENLKVEKYDGYWQELNCVTSATFKFIADADSAYMELQSGTIDVLQYLTSDKAAALGDDYNIAQSTMMLVHGLFLNNTYGPLADVRVRQALNYAVDRNAINEYLFGGESVIIETHAYPRITKYYNKDTESVYSYDVDKAKELLAAAGYADGFDLEITVPSNYAQHVSTCEILAEQLKAVGINVTINKVEWSSWLSDVYQGRNYQSTVIGIDGTLAPGNWFTRYYSPSANDFTNFTNSEYDSIYQQALATIDDNEKVSLYKQLQTIITENAASVFIEDPADFVAVSKKFAGYTAYPVAAIDLSSVYPVE